MGKHEELMIAIHRADVAAVSKLLAKTSGSKSSMFLWDYCFLPFSVQYSRIKIMSYTELFHYSFHSFIFE